MFLLDDTIAALASAAGSAGRGIIRCSGPQVRQLLEQRFHPTDSTAWSTSKMAQRHAGQWDLSDLSRPVPVDVYFWPNHRSYTGQPQAEIHTVGSVPILETILGDLYALGARPAQPGEFTLRAFLAGRIDLMQAEAVLGVIDAADRNQLLTALTQLSGGISWRLTQLRAEFLDLLADLEAGLDFTEEGLEFVSRSVLTNRITTARDELQSLLEAAQARSRHTVRPRVVIAGPPNAGKSTLFNALLGRSAALVSPIAGTTRDYLTAEVEWHGVPIELIDTAGLEETSDAILQAALELRAGQVEGAQLVLECRSAASEWNVTSQVGWPVEAKTQRHSLFVLTKCDLLTGSNPQMDREMGGRGSRRAFLFATGASCSEEELKQSPLAPVLRGEGSGVRGKRASPCPLTPSPAPPSTGARGASPQGKLASSLEAAQSPRSLDASGSAGASPPHIDSSTSVKLSDDSNHGLADAGSVRHGVAISALTGDGLAELKSQVAEILKHQQKGESQILGSTAARCRDSLEQAIAALDRASQLATSGGGEEFLATDVREALEELGKITGAIYTDDLLDRIFSKFCIGK